MSEQMEKRLAGLGLPDDIIETALTDQPGPTPEAVARIREMALAKATAQPAESEVSPAPVTKLPRQNRRRTTLWIAATAAVLLLALGMVGPARVIGAVQQLLAYVPGFGLQERGEGQLAAVRTVREVRGDRSVEVLGLLASEGSVSVRFQTRGFVFEQEQVTLTTEAGSVLTGTANSVTSAHGMETLAEGWYTFAGRPDLDTKAFTLVIRGAEEWRLHIPVVPVTGLAGLEQFGQTVTANGYTFAGRLLAGSDQTEVVLLAQGGERGARIRSLGDTLGGLQRPVLRTRSGSVPLREDAGVGEVRRLVADPVSGDTDRATVLIPAMVVTEEGEATFRLDVANQHVSEIVRLGRVSFRITRTEVVDGNLRIYVDPGPTNAVAFARYGFLEVNGKPSSASMSKHNEVTGLMEYFEVEIPPPAQRLTLTIHGVEVLLQGPWILDLPVERP